MNLTIFHLYNVNKEGKCKQYSIKHLPTYIHNTYVHNTRTALHTHIHIQSYTKTYTRSHTQSHIHKLITHAQSESSTNATKRA